MTERVILVLGATGGIGSALARRLRASGVRLALAARSEKALSALAAEVDGLAMPLDARLPLAVEQAATDTKDRLGRLDGIVNAVGSLLLKPAHLTTPEEWDDVIATNLRTAFCTVAAGARQLSDGGSVVLLSSAAGRVGLANHEAIAAAKAGVIGLALAAAATYASKGIRFNVVAPGLVRTQMTSFLTGSEPMLKANAAMHPLGRIGEPDDVAGAIAWLLSSEAAWVTGQVLGVDGGLATVRGRR